jgi:hypothetical protein
MAARLSHLIRWLMQCHCGHRRDFHQHYRAGTDCSQCPCTHYHGKYLPI